MMYEYIDNIKKISTPNKKIMCKIIQTNINRVFYLSLISVPLRFLMIGLFLTKPPARDEKEAIWRVGILISHFVYLILILVLGSLSYKLRKKTEPNLIMVIVQYVTVIMLMLTGAIISSIDQLVTYSITPFLIACTAIGVLFLIKPLHSLIIFLSGYIIYFFAMGIMQPALPILLSNRVNGITSVGLGIILSFVLWNYNVVNLQQKEYIEIQKKELEEKNIKLQHLAAYDSLTGLLNRRYFEERAIKEISRIKRYGNESCFLILDIDDFKRINDEFGHPTGDKLLKSFASLLTSQLREYDIISRIGGEEFAILLTDTNCRGGKAVAEKIRSIIEKQTFIIEENEINITVSIGITLINSKQGSFEEGYKYADKALYNAKANGRNRVETEFCS